MRLLKYLLALLLAAAPAKANFASFQVAAASSFTPSWQTLRLGGGGQITNIAIDPTDGTTVTVNDTYGAYLYVPSGSCSGWGTTYSAPCWTQLVTATTIPSPSWTTTAGALNYQATSLVACHSNTNDAYMVWGGKLYVTTNLKQAGGPTWVATTLTGLLSGLSNGIQQLKGFGDFLACDPNNPNVVYVTKPGTGTIYSTNGLSGGSATFTTDATLGTGSGTGCSGASLCGSVIAFDTSSAFSGGFTQRLMVCNYGSQCWLTTNGGNAAGGSWTQTASGPTAYSHLRSDKFGQFWVANNSSTIYRYASGAWGTQNSGGPTQDFAFDPASSAVGSNHIVSVEFGGQLSVSSNNGGTWTGEQSQNPGNATASAPQPVWLGVANQTSGGVQFLNSLAIAFDTSSNVWNAAGLGVWTTPAPVTTGLTQTPWTSNNIGIEQLVVNQVVVPPGNSPLTSQWDKGFMLVKNPDVFPSIYWNNSTSLNPIMGGWSLDYASAGGTTNFLTGWEISNAGSGTSPASSSDGGNTWTQWPSFPTLINQSGNVAASTSTNWIAVAGCSSCGGTGSSPVLNFTTNAGTTWTASTIAGTPTFSQQVGVRFPLAADRVTAGSFCAVDLNLNFYNSTNSGSSFTLVATSSAVDGSGGNGADTLVSVPGQAGHYFYTSGSASGTHPLNTHLWKSTNSCAGWTNVNANLKEVMAVGFGAPLPGGGGYPSIYVYGWLSGVLGFYQSNDGGTTWASINAPASQLVFPGATLDFLNQLSGDPNVYGRFYTSSRASGAKYIDTQDACPWVNFSNTNPNASLTGTVSLQATASGKVPVTAVDFYVDGTLIGRQTTGTGTPAIYTQSWVTGGVATGAHTLKVLAEGSTNASCNTSLAAGNSFSIPITTH